MRGQNSWKAREPFICLACHNRTVALEHLASFFVLSALEQSMGFLLDTSACLLMNVFHKGSHRAPSETCWWLTSIEGNASWVGAWGLADSGTPVLPHINYVNTYWSHTKQQPGRPLRPPLRTGHVASASPAHLWADRLHALSQIFRFKELKKLLREPVTTLGDLNSIQTDSELSTLFFPSLFNDRLYEQDA